MHQPMLGTFHTEPVVRSEDSELIQQVLTTSWSPCQFRRPEMQNKCCYCESITSDPTSKTRLDGGAFTSRLNGSIISFVGDSLVRQLFYMLVCLLSSHVDQHSSFPYWACDSMACLHNYSRVVVRDPTTHAAVILQNKWHPGSFPRNERDHPLFRDAQIVVFGTGAVLSQAQVKQVLSTWQTEFLDGFRGQVIWLEYFGGHFPGSSDGEFEGSSRHIALERMQNGKSPCAPLVDKAIMRARSNLRHSVSSKVAQLAGWQELRSFNQSVHEYTDHPGWKNDAGSLDCRHWCFNPSGGTLVQRVGQLLHLLRPSSRQSHSGSRSVVASG